MKIAGIIQEHHLHQSSYEQLRKEKGKGTGRGGKGEGRERGGKRGEGRGGEGRGRERGGGEKREGREGRGRERGGGEEREGEGREDTVFLVDFDQPVLQTCFCEDSCLLKVPHTAVDSEEDKYI